MKSMAEDKREIVVIGDEDLISGLRIFGFDIFLAKGNIAEIFSLILEKDYKICLVQETYFSQIKDLSLPMRERSFPLILPISDHREIKGTGKRILRELGIRAVGVDIWK